MTGEDLQLWRRERGLQQQQLAKKLGSHIITVNRWENGARDIPSWLHLALIGLDALDGKLPEKKPRKKKK